MVADRTGRRDRVAGARGRPTLLQPAAQRRMWGPAWIQQTRGKHRQRQGKRAPREGTKTEAYLGAAGGTTDRETRMSLQYLTAKPTLGKNLPPRTSRQTLRWSLRGPSRSEPAAPADVVASSVVPARAGGPWRGGRDLGGACESNVEVPGVYGALQGPARPTHEEACSNMVPRCQQQLAEGLRLLAAGG